METHIGLENGNYLDIGCYHPVGISNTFLLHKKGWQGVVVDIDDYKLKLFKKRRGISDVEVVKGAISSQDSKSKVAYINLISLSLHTTLFQRKLR